MKRTILTASLIAALAVPAFAQQSTQLAQSLQNKLAIEGIHGVDLSGASVDELARVKWVLDDTDTSVDQESRIQAIVR